MFQLRLDGHTYAFIAKKADVSRQRVQQLLSPPIAIRDYIVNKNKGLCQVCGIYVGSSGDVHHIGCDKVEQYNDIENLQLLCRSCHRKQHEEKVKLVCTNCSCEFEVYPYDAKRRFANKSGKVFCSLDCLGKYKKGKQSIC